MLYKTIEVKVWADPDLRELSDQGKLLFLYLKSNRQAHYSGLYELELTTVLAQLKWTEVKFLKVMAEISAKPFVMYDPRVSLFFVVNALSYNLKYGNQKNLIKGITKHLSTFHRSILLNAFHNKYKDLGYAIPMGYEWVTDPSNTVTVTDTVINSIKEGEIKKNPPGEMVIIPDWIKISTWNCFSDMRNKIKKPMTNRAMENIIAKLGRFKDAGEDPEVILNRSITNCWQDVFSIKGDGRKGGSGNSISKTLEEKAKDR